MFNYSGKLDVISNNLSQINIISNILSKYYYYPKFQQTLLKLDFLMKTIIFENFQSLVITTDYIFIYRWLPEIKVSFISKYSKLQFHS